GQLEIEENYVRASFDQLLECLQPVARLQHAVAGVLEQVRHHRPNWRVVFDDKHLGSSPSQGRAHATGMLDERHAARQRAGKKRASIATAAASGKLDRRWRMTSGPNSCLRPRVANTRQLRNAERDLNGEVGEVGRGVARERSVRIGEGK